MHFGPDRFLRSIVRLQTIRRIDRAHRSESECPEYGSRWRDRLSRQAWKESVQIVDVPLWGVHLACREDLEGIVAKLRNGTYDCQHGTSWIKTKNPGYTQIV